MEQQTGSKLGNSCVKAEYSHPAYLTYMQNTSWEMPGRMQHKRESRLPGEIYNTSDMQIDSILRAESKEELKILLMKVKEESEKAGLKLNIQKTKIMASSPFTSCQIDGETMETVTDFIFCLQNHYGWWLQPWNLKKLVPWKKSYDKPRQHIKKQRHRFADKGLYNQRYGFSSSHIQM